MLFLALNCSNNATRYKLIVLHMCNSVELWGRLGNRVIQKERPSGCVATIFAANVDHSRSDRVGQTNVEPLLSKTFRVLVLSVRSG